MDRKPLLALLVVLMLLCFGLAYFFGTYLATAATKTIDQREQEQQQYPVDVNVVPPQVINGWCCEKPGTNCQVSHSSRLCLTSGGKTFGRDQELCNKVCLHLK